MTSKTKEIHQIWKGDSRELVKRFKPGRVDCLITDPPFGVNNKSNLAITPRGREYARKIEGDESLENAVALFTDVWEALHPALSDVADVYIFTSYQVLADWIKFLDDLLGGNRYERKAIIVWQKEGPGTGDINSPWGMGCEFILFYQRGRKKSARRSNCIINYPQIPPGKLIHPHEKPVPLLERLIKTSTYPGDFLVDPFSGSGALVRAARISDRNAVGIEKDENNYQKSIDALDDQGDSLF